MPTSTPQNPMVAARLIKIVADPSSRITAFAKASVVPIPPDQSPEQDGDGKDEFGVSEYHGFPAYPEHQDHEGDDYLDEHG